VGCKDTKAEVPPKGLIVIDRLLRAGRPAGVKHRLAVCLRASDCGWPCRRLVKAVGLMVYCQADTEAGIDGLVSLRKALADPDWHCPEGRF